ncbi:MAG: DUF2341 domain-containing protein, partial [Thermoplasmata archaeon]|nr:DUF2341 domain-containing protein [Thermoplasmata archaeon]
QQSSTNWQYRKKITIDNTKVQGSSDLSSFPVLINLASDSGLASHAQDDGDDILFTSSDGATKLDHEIEKFVYSTGELQAWVKIPTLPYNTDTVIYMYYGKSDASNQENPTGVWDTNYKMVQHLEESPNDDVVGHFDSTSNDNDGMPKNFQDGGGGTTDATGKIDGADDFAGDDDNVEVPNDASLNPSSITVEAWVKLDVTLSSQPTAYPMIVFKRDSTDGFGIYYDKGDNQLDVTLREDGWSMYSNTPVTWTTTAWHHIGVTYDLSTDYWILFVNGEVEHYGSTSFYAGSSSNLYIGSWDNTGCFCADGTIDDVRISDTARSGDWIKTEYNNQNSPGTFMSFGSEETYGEGVVVINEVMYKPSGINEEWVELYNSGSASVNIDGWEITDEDGTTGNNEYAIPDIPDFPSHNYVVIHYTTGTDETSFGQSQANALHLYTGDDTDVFDDAGDQVSLYTGSTHSSTTIADFVAWDDDGTLNGDQQSDDANAVAAGIWD